MLDNHKAIDSKLYQDMARLDDSETSHLKSGVAPDAFIRPVIESNIIKGRREPEDKRRLCTVRAFPVTKKGDLRLIHLFDEI